MCRYCANGDSLLRSDRPLTRTLSNEKFVQRAKFSSFVPSSLTCVLQYCPAMLYLFVHLYVLLCIFSQLSKDIKMYFGVRWDEGWVRGRPSLEVHQSASSSAASASASVHLSISAGSMQGRGLACCSTGLNTTHAPTSNMLKMGNEECR